MSNLVVGDKVKLIRDTLTVEQREALIEDGLYPPLVGDVGTIIARTHPIYNFIADSITTVDWGGKCGKWEINLEDLRLLEDEIYGV